MMNNRADTLEKLYNDEIVRFLADRYHTTPREVLQCFHEQNGVAYKMAAGTFRLEDNEMAMLHNMIIKLQK